MSNPHEVIVYRNPLEYAIWNSNYLVMFLILAVVYVVSVVVIDAILRKVLFRVLRATNYKHGKLIRHIHQWAPLTLAGVVVLIFITLIF